MDELRKRASNYYELKHTCNSLSYVEDARNVLDVNAVWRHVMILTCIRWWLERSLTHPTETKEKNARPTAVHENG